MKILAAGLLLVCGNAFASDGLTLEMSRKVAERALQYGAKKSWKLSVAVVNAEGNLIYFAREDGAYTGSIDAAADKAKSSNAFQRPTRAFAEGIQAGRNGLLSVRGVVAIEGGVPIIVKGKHLGAIGVSGAKSTEDEEAALDGLKALEGK